MYEKRIQIALCMYVFSTFLSFQSTMSKFKIPILANCGHCKNKIRNVDLCKQNDGCFLCPECDQEDILRKFHSVSQNLVLLTNSRLIEVSTDFSISRALYLIRSPMKNLKHPRTILFGQIGLVYMLIDIGMPKVP